MSVVGLICSFFVKKSGEVKEKSAVAVKTKTETVQQ
jgi:hypothetical protein